VGADVCSTTGVPAVTTDAVQALVDIVRQAAGNAPACTDLPVTGAPLAVEPRRQPEGDQG